MRICRPGDLSVAAEWLRDGGIVAFPTDTFYGLAVDPASAAAVRRLFALKGREARAALPLVAASTRQVETLCGRLGSTDARLAARFWPGPLSLIFDAPAHAGNFFKRVDREVQELPRDLPKVLDIGEETGIRFTQPAPARLPSIESQGETQ